MFHRSNGYSTTCKSDNSNQRLLNRYAIEVVLALWTIFILLQTFFIHMLEIDYLSFGYAHLSCMVNLELAIHTLAIVRVTLGLAISYITYHEQAKPPTKGSCISEHRIAIRYATSGLVIEVHRYIRDPRR